MLLIGNRTNEDGTDRWSLIPGGARVLHIDIDPQEIGRNYEAMRLLGDAKATLDALTHGLGNQAQDRNAIERQVADAWAAFERNVRRFWRTPSRSAPSASLPPSRSAWAREPLLQRMPAILRAGWLASFAHIIPRRV